LFKARVTNGNKATEIGNKLNSSGGGIVEEGASYEKKQKGRVGPSNVSIIKRAKKLTGMAGKGRHW